MIDDIWSTLSDTRQLGLATLITVGAVFFGFIVQRILPRSANRVVVGWLAATGLVAGLAYMGVPAAALVLALFIAGAILIGILALLFN